MLSPLVNAQQLAPGPQIQVQPQTQPANLPAPPIPPQPSAMVRGSVPKVVAKRVIIVDDRTGAVIYEKNSLEKVAVASTQKLLTALCVIDAGPLSDMVYVQTSDTKVEPSKVYIKSGEKFNRGQLLKALMVKSGNDVAKALARDVAGTEAKFIERMNAKARQIGMLDSNFKNPHGLTEEGQYSTARDIAILARAATRNSNIADYVKNRGYYFIHNNGKKRWLQNTNELLKKVSYCTGMKTGTTRASGRCLVSTGELNGRKVIVVCLGSDATNVFTDSSKLLKWALVPASKPPRAVPVK